VSQVEEADIDPEPFSLLLIVLGAAGSVASLVSWADDRSQRRERERETNRFAVRDAIMGAETSLNELRGLVRSLEITFETGSRRVASDDRSSMSMAQFGRVSLVFTHDGLFQMGISRTSLFPGLDGFAKSLDIFHPVVHNPIAWK